MTNDSLFYSVANNFRPDAEPLFFEMMRNHRLGAHEAILLKDISITPTDVAGLFAYGQANLPKEEKRPDETLAGYFCLLAELKEIPADVRDLATEAMVFCKNDSYTLPQSRASILEDFKKIIPRSLNRDTSKATDS